MKTSEFRVESAAAGVRLDQFLAGTAAGLSRARIQDLIKEGNVTLNGGAFNVFESGGLAPLTTNGTYNLLDYTGGFTGALANLSIANSQVGKFYGLANDAANTLIKLTVADTTISEWNGGAANGLWTTPGNWTDPSLA